MILIAMITKCRVYVHVENFYSNGLGAYINKLRVSVQNKYRFKFKSMSHMSIQCADFAGIYFNPISIILF